MIVHITYILLNILMFVTLYITGVRISKLKKVTVSSVIKASFIGVLGFTLNEGLRYGRGIDYNIYSHIFYDVPDRKIDLYEPIFRNLIHLLRFLDMPFQMLVMIMSFTLIVSLVVLVLNFREAAPMALPAFPLFFIQPENIMRWYFGLSLVLIGWSFMLRNKGRKDTILFWIFVILGMMIHYGMILLPIGYVICNRIKKPIMKPWLSITLFLIVGLAFQSKMMLVFSNMVNVFTLVSDKASGYVAHAEQWLTGGASVLMFRAFPKMLELIIYILVVCYGYRLVDKLKSHKFVCLYNVFVVGFIVLPIGNQIEIFSRYQQSIFLTIYILIGYIFYYLKRRDGALFKSPIKHLYKPWHAMLFLYIMASVYMVRFVYQGFKKVEYQQLYIWNSEGEKHLDLDKTYYKDLKAKKHAS